MSDQLGAWERELLVSRKYVKKLDKKKPVIICGDMNVAHTEIDLKNPKSNKRNAGFTQEERDGFSELLGAGFVDSFRLSVFVFSYRYNVFVNLQTLPSRQGRGLHFLDLHDELQR